MTLRRLLWRWLHRLFFTVFAYWRLIFCFCINREKGIACKLRIFLQDFVILEVHICLERCLFCLCCFPVGFQLMAAVALFEFPLSRTLRRARQVPPICCALRAGIVFLDAVDFVVNKIPASCAGGITGCCGLCRRVSAFPVPQSAGGSFCLSCGFVKGALLNQFLLLWDSCLCCVQSVSGFFRFLM